MLETTVQALLERVRSLEEQMRAVNERLGIQGPQGPSIPAEVEQLLKEGKRMQAIQAYQQATGCSLAEAQAAIVRVM